jgi:predicted regulator of Ras-like GTPase activity (Roadblock/LC7/MglB family)
MTAPSDDLRPKPEPWLTMENPGLESEGPAAPLAVAALPAEKKKEVRIALLLKPILQSLPPFQLSGDASVVPEDARVELPFSLIEPQLASGRISLSPGEFATALPSEYRGLFNAAENGDAVALPLQELLKNLPSASLRMRDDQEEAEAGQYFATPFSAKAEEDAKRFLDAGPVMPKPITKAPPVKKPAIKAKPEPMADPALPAPGVVSAKLVPAPAAQATEAGSRTALQAALETDDDELDAKAVVIHIGKMAGVTACALMFADGLSLAGNLPEAYQADVLCAMAPSLLQRVENHMAKTKLGALRAMTLSCAQAAVTFFMHGNLCLAALHAKEELSSDVRERLARAVQELSQKYSLPV